MFMWDNKDSMNMNEGLNVIQLLRIEKYYIDINWKQLTVWSLRI